MLFRLLRSFFPPFIMWIDGDGGSDLGTAGVESTGDIAGDISTESSSTGEPETEQPPQVSYAEFQKIKEDNERLKEYAEFIKQAPPAQQQQLVRPEIDPKEVTYAEDVDKIVDYKLNVFMQLEEQKALERDMRSLAETTKAKDTLFESRMELALEFLERDPVAQGQFDRARTAQEKIAVLEKCAKWNPRFDLLKKPETPSVENEAIRKLKENSEIPPTLNTMQTAGKTQKAVSEMNEQEFNEFFQSVVKGY